MNPLAPSLGVLPTTAFLITLLCGLFALFLNPRLAGSPALLLLDLPSPAVLFALCLAFQDIFTHCSSLEPSLLTPGHNTSHINIV